MSRRCGWRLRCRPGDESGAADLIAVIVLAPAIIGFAALLIWLGRQVDTSAQVRTAAAAAAQAAVLERSADAAQGRARQVAATILSSPRQCAHHEVAISLGEFRPGDEVTVRVDCEMSSEGLGLIGPPTVRFGASSTARLDRYRAIP